MAEPSVVAIGRLEAGGAWVGLRRSDAGYALVFGEPDGSRLTSVASRAELLAVAICYFEEAMEDAPPELEATQHDLALLLRWLLASERDSRLAALLLEALEGIDDGLAGDVMVRRLWQALDATGTPNEQASLDLLVDRYRSLRR